MSFDSPAYLLFLPAAVLLHWALPHRYRWAALLGASYVFYAGWNAALSLLILFVTGCTYLAGLLLERTDSRLARRLPALTEEARPHCPEAVWAGLLLALCLAALIRMDSGTASAFIYFQF